MCTLLGLSHADIFYENLRSKVSERVGESQLLAIEKLGCLDDVPVKKSGSPLDTLSQYLSTKLSLGKSKHWFPLSTRYKYLLTRGTKLFT